MMYCLHCGDCCLRMSPLSAPEPCPYVIRKDDFYFCGCYKNRPKECSSHHYPARFCPVGMSVTGLDKVTDARVVAQRIDTGYELIKEVENENSL